MAWPTLADLARLSLPGTDGPIEVRFAPDGASLTYLRGDPGSQVRSLWRHDLATDERILLAGPAQPSAQEEALSVEEQLQRERRRTGSLGITEYAWAPRAALPTIVVPAGGGVLAGIGEAARTGPLEPLPGVEGVSAAAVSPDGQWLGFVREGDVWLAALAAVASAGGEPRRVTTDARDGVANGLADYAAAEELSRFEGMWWSWDGSLLAFAHVDEREVPLLTIPHLGEDGGAQESHRYPFAGGPNARVSLRMVAAAGGEVREVPLPGIGDGYLARVVAHPRGGWLVAVLPRDQRELRWHRLDPDGRVRPLWTEPGEPWIDMDDDTRVLGDGRILRTTERGGFRHLELRSADGATVRRLTGGNWVITRVVEVDEARGLAYFLATRDGATERHLYRVPLDAATPPEDPERMTAEPGWHDPVMDRSGDRWADTWSDLATAPRLSVHDAQDGGDPRVIVEASATAGSLGVTPPELLTVTGADGRTPLDAALYRPARPTSTPPPCVVWVYGGPHAQYVKRSWEATAHPLRQYLARAGVAVLVVDNRGSAFRGIGFEALLEGRLGEAEVEDQAAAVQQLAERGEIDPARVGITGGSYGGYMTLRAMALEPDVFRVGVAVAPVTDWRGYDTAYTERYLGLPAQNAAAYEASSALGLADRIRGSLLLIHGAIDENVHLRHSVRMVAALQAIGRDVELVILPSDRHRTRSATGLATRERRTVRHLLSGLGVPLPDELAGS